MSNVCSGIKSCACECGSVERVASWRALSPAPKGAAAVGNKQPSVAFVVVVVVVETGIYAQVTRDNRVQTRALETTENATRVSLMFHVRRPASSLSFFLPIESSARCLFAHTVRAVANKLIALVCVCECVSVADVRRLKLTNSANWLQASRRARDRKKQHTYFAQTRVCYFSCKYAHCNIRPARERASKPVA